MSKQVERREDGTVVISAVNGDPILKLGEGSTVLYRFGDHVLDSRAAALPVEALEALRDWCVDALPVPAEISGGGHHPDDRG